MTIEVGPWPNSCIDVAGTRPPSGCSSFLASVVSSQVFFFIGLEDEAVRLILVQFRLAQMF
jgi:hypothetical protein